MIPQNGIELNAIETDDRTTPNISESLSNVVGRFGVDEFDAPFLNLSHSLVKKRLLILLLSVFVIAFTRDGMKTPVHCFMNRPNDLFGGSIVPFFINHGL